MKTTQLELARIIVRDARRDLGHDLGGFSVVDLLVDNMNSISLADARELVAAIDTLCAL